MLHSVALCCIWLSGQAGLRVPGSRRSLKCSLAVAWHGRPPTLCMIGASPFAKVILSEAKDLGVQTVEILRYAQDDDFGRLSPMLMHNVGLRPCGVGPRISASGQEQAAAGSGWLGV